MKMIFQLLFNFFRKKTPTNYNSLCWFEKAVFHEDFQSKRRTRKNLNLANEKKWNKICKGKHSDVVHENTKLMSHQWKIPVYDVNAINTKINNRIYWTIYKYNRFRSVGRRAKHMCVWPTLSLRSAFSVRCSILLQSDTYGMIDASIGEDYNHLHCCEHSFLLQASPSQPVNAIALHVK